jgi:hypothetical protein
LRNSKPMVEEHEDGCCKPPKRKVGHMWSILVSLQQFWKHLKLLTSLQKRCALIYLCEPANSLQDSDCMSSLDSRKKHAMVLYPIPSHSLYTYLESQHSLLASPDAVKGGESGRPLPSAYFTMNFSNESSTVAWYSHSCMNPSA